MASTLNPAWLIGFPLPADNAAERAVLRVFASGREKEGGVVGKSHEGEAAWEATAVARVLAGEIAAFDPLVDAYTTRMYTHVYRMLRQREEAEDVVQETFLRAYRSLATFDASRAFRSWLYAIATNLALNALRARQRRGQPVEFDFDAETFDAPAASVVDARDIVARGELAEWLARAVQALPAQPAALVHLHYVEGMTIREAADVVNMSEDAAKVALHRARKRLREVLEQER